ncbi:hypothetical protein HMPREF0501_00483 [Limosilactobacillus coleohominis 101-4-CHN]|uniref:Uncharacterized protein n=1 Tax=Limosilactobacillus coleohominis 101-4-CHN TaxID=575594 RepID=C7XUW7_9LACO|nr:hypothetical protein [Limosilactobacillus coleohominis]EEU31078.1 hypothetical protein HMPREF0501_00483 [Limosilactobacillus coleohominis 101-4-CHN]
MKYLECKNCGCTIGLDQESEDDRYWYAPKCPNIVFCTIEDCAYWYGFKNVDQGVKALNIKFAYASDIYQDQLDEEEHERYLADRNRDGYVDSHYLDARGVYVGY